MDIKNFTLKKYEEHLEKIIISRGMQSNNITENRENITEFEHLNQPKNKFKRYIHNKKFVLDRNIQILNLKSRPFQRKSGYQEIPRILIDQSNKHLRNKYLLSKFIEPADRTLKGLF